MQPKNPPEAPLASASSPESPDDGSNPIAQPPITPPQQKKSRKPVYILVVIIVAIIIGGLAYILLKPDSSDQPKDADSKNSVANQTYDEHTTADAKEIIDGVKSALAANITVTDGKYSESSGYKPPAAPGSLILYAHDGFGPTMPVTGYDFRVAPRNATVLGVAAYIDSSYKNDPQDSALVQRVLAEYFKPFKPAAIYVEGIANDSPDAIDFTAAYQNDVAICSYNKQAVNPSVSCADKATYPKEAAAIKPLAEAWDASPLLTCKDCIYDYSILSLGDSTSVGYRIASIEISGARAQLFKKDTETAWHVYARGTMSPGCDVDSIAASAGVSAADARAAFKGEACSDENGSGTIQ
jgi:hypothetical protein